MSNKAEEVLKDAKERAKEMKGRLKEAAGDLIDDNDLEREGHAERKRMEEQRKAEALDEMADEKRQKAAGYKGEEISRKQN